MSALDDLKARVDLVELVGRYVELTRRGRDWWGCCPFHEDSTPSFKVSPQRGRFHCFGCGADGDSLHFVMRIERVTLRDALARLSELIGDDPGARPRRRQEPDRQPQGLTPVASRFLASCRPLAPDGAAARYLIGRRCARPGGDVLEHPDHRHPSGWRGPAMIAVITNAVTGELVSLHQTWIMPDGSGKAPVERPRLYWEGLTSRGVCRLFDDAEVTMGLLVGEGLETCLTAARGFGPAVWACLDAGNLGALPVLPGIEALTIVTDHDPAGIAARDACTERWLKAGREVIHWLAPQAGVDLNDYVGKCAT